MHAPLNWRGRIGVAAGTALHYTLSRPAFPFTRYVPPGLSWIYDVQRWAGTRDLAVLVDAGANVGQTVGHFRKYCPRASIYAFEPVAATHATLQSAWSHDRRVICEHLALGSTRGPAEIVVYEDSQLNTLVKQGPRETGHERIETIAIETLDAYCTRRNIARVDILKMDVQGWELEVLNGARQLLDARAVKAVYAEVGFRQEDRDMQPFSALNDYLDAQGFWFSGFYEFFRWGPHKERLAFANALYLLRDK